MRECDSCGQLFDILKRRYFGKSYCSSCYSYLFPKSLCTECHKEKRIFRNETSQRCQQCTIANLPCHRCSKSSYRLGKITHFGPVCSACARYYNEERACSKCGLQSKWVSRYLFFGENEPICFKCLRSTHFKRCIICRGVKAPFFSTLEGENICRACEYAPIKLCVSCEVEIPGGAFGKKCRKCFSETTLLKRLKINKAGFVTIVADLYVSYGEWLSKRCGPAKASRQILLDRNVFGFLDDCYRQTSTFPKYERYRKELCVNQNRQNILAKKFLIEKGVFNTTPAGSELVGDKNTIRRVIQTQQTEASAHSAYLLGYYRNLLGRYRKRLSSVRSVRLALTPASELLLLARKQGREQVDQELVNQYLWLHLGQRAALTGFINYLRSHHKIEVVIPSKQYFVLSQSTETRKHSRAQLIEYCRNDGKLSAKYIQLAFPFYHRVNLPPELRKLDLCSHCKTSSKMLSLRIAQQVYWLPNLGEELFHI